jgi:hypothetical protein
MDEDEPTVHMIFIDPVKGVTNDLPTLPEWIQQDNTHITIHHKGRERKGALVKTDNGWKLEQRTTSGSTTCTLDLTDLPITWQDPTTGIY